MAVRPYQISMKPWAPQPSRPSLQPSGSDLMSKPYTFENLRKDVAAGTIDTVLACLVDMQGRLMGKRFHAEFFVESGHDETHSCNYLLATDIEMNTVPGYRATSWEAGYGDYIMKPDLSPLRK